GEVWQFGDSSIGNKWGKAPTVMSAGQFEVFINSDSNRVVAHPLDATGNLMAGQIEGIRITGTNTFKLSLDQSQTKTPWYHIAATNASASVADATNSF